MDLIWPVLCRIKKIRKHEYLSSSFFWLFFCDQNRYKVIFMVLCKYSDQDRIPHSGMGRWVRRRWTWLSSPSFWVWTSRRHSQAHPPALGGPASWLVGRFLSDTPVRVISRLPLCMSGGFFWLQQLGFNLQFYLIWFGGFARSFLAS